jgi:hypothetical protein
MAVRRAHPLKKTAIVSVVLALAVLMVLPAISGVNHPVNNLNRIQPRLQADGWPLPPGPTGSASTLVADGWPLPPGPTGSTASLVADGWTLPPGPTGSAASLDA